MKAINRSARTGRKATSPRSEAVSLGHRFQQLKMSLRRQITAEFQSLLPVALIRRAMDEAEQLALESGFPHLFFPELAKEQVRRVAGALHGSDSFSDRSTAEVCAA
jgi:hypothetical protein